MALIRGKGKSASDATATSAAKLADAVPNKIASPKTASVKTASVKTASVKAAPAKAPSSKAAPAVVSSVVVPPTAPAAVEAVTPTPQKSSAPVVKTEPVAVGASSAKNTANTMEQAMQFTKEHMDKASDTFFKSFDDMAVFNKGNVDAVVKSSTIVARGAEELSRHVMTLFQSNLEQSVATARAAMGCTTLKQVVDLQSDLAKTAFDKAVSESSKISELSMKVANEAIEPIQARVSLAVEKFIKPVAA